MDPLPFVRNHMISYIFDLLRDKPEQEQPLLRLLVNKLVQCCINVVSKIRVTEARRSLQRPHISSSNYKLLILR